MKKCPHCAEEIQDEAILCKHCGSLLEQKVKEKWYFRTTSLVMIFLVIGPFALPLVWLHPRYSDKAKVIITVIVLVLSYYAGKVLFHSIESITKYYQQISVFTL